VKIPNITGLAKVGKTFIQANRPEILFGASITATIASVILAAKGGYEARGLVDEEIRRRDAANEQEPALTSKEKIQLTWLCYMPAAITTVTALGSTAGLHLVHVKDKKALVQTGLAALEEVKTSAKEFEKESLGVLSTEEKDRILTDRQKEVPILDEQGREAAHVQNSDHVITAMYLVRDSHTGRDFWANENKIQAAVNEVNNLAVSRGDVDLNTFYVWAGVPEIKNGDEVGWAGGDFVTLKWQDGHREDGTPLREFTFQPPPAKGYDAPHR
jgi:hypothetical protein